MKIQWVLLFSPLIHRTNGFRPMLDNSATRGTPPIFLPTHLASLGSQFHPPLFPHLKGNLAVNLPFATNNTRILGALASFYVKQFANLRKLNFCCINYSAMLFLVAASEHRNFANRWFYDRYSIKYVDWNDKMACYTHSHNTLQSDNRQCKSSLYS